MPIPLLGTDIASVNKGDVVPFTGVLMSPMYLNTYLQWKCTAEGKC